MTANAFAPPVRPREIKTVVEQSPESLELCIPYHYLGQTVFFSMWLTGWTLGCVLLAYEAFTKFELITFLFATPFWAGWWVGAGILFGSWLRRDRLRLDEQGLAYEKRVGRVLKQCLIPLSELKSFRAYRGPADEDNCCDEGMEAIGAGKNLRFAESLSKKEIGWLVAILNLKLAELCERTGQRWADGAELVVTDDPPRESRLTIDLDHGDLVFKETGRWDWAEVGLALFAVLFWNGIVSVFVCGLWGLTADEKWEGFPSSGPTWWVAFIFLIPFEVIGLCLIGLLVGKLLQPRRVKTWRFSGHIIETGTAYWGIGRSKRYDLSDCRKIEICEKPQLPPKFLGRSSVKTAGDPDGTQFALSLIDSGEQELCAMTELTMAEAYWMRHHLTKTSHFAGCTMSHMPSSSND